MKTYTTTINDFTATVTHEPDGWHVEDTDQCDDCGGSDFELIFSGGSPHALRCDCGATYRLREVGRSEEDACA